MFADFPGISCLATIIWSLRDKEICVFMSAQIGTRRIQSYRRQNPFPAFTAILAFSALSWAFTVFSAFDRC